MKKYLLFSLLACGAMTLQAQITESATEAVKNMGLGWNLGNTLDANRSAGKDITAASYWGQQGIESETYWGQPVTKPELFKMMKEAGFGAIRVPVTWFNHMDKDGNVDKAWMKRVHEVVDYVIDNGLYCIVNVHHDTGADSNDHTSWIKAEEDNYKATKERFEDLWQQIATEFKDYGKELLFEGYNEMLDGKSTWNAPKNSSSYNAINQYAQSFVTAVRATGGNNETRNLIVNTYAAANNEVVEKLIIPTDQAKNHIIAEVHAYPNFFTWSSNPTLRTIQQVKNDVDYIVNNLKKNLIDKGTPAIIGEWGSYGVDNGTGKTDYDARKDMFFEFCEYFLQKAKAQNIAMFYWMGLTDGMSRSELVFSQADLAELFAKTYHGSSFQGKYPTMKPIESHVCFEGEKAIAWGNGINIAADILKAIDGDMRLDITFSYKSGDDDIQLFDGNWKNKPSFNIDGTNYNGDFNPRTKFSSTPTESQSISITFDSQTNKDLKNAGLIIHGNDVTLYKVVISSINASSIETHEDTEASSGLLYDLSGHRVNRATKGIYIQGGKKIFVK